MSGLDIAAFVVGAAGLIAGGASAWYTRGQAKAAADAVVVAREAKDEANRTGREAKAVAEKANELAGAANRIATDSGIVAGDSKRIAEAANDLAAKANALSVKANTLAGESNDIAREALQVSRESAVSARESARAAEATADHERSTLQMARDQRHEDCRPHLPPRLDVKVSSDAQGHEFYFVELELGGDYRVEATTFTGDSSSPTPMDALIRKGAKVKVFVEHIAPGQLDVKADRIKFRFWPPASTDDVDPWTCGCGSPELPDGGRGHWERTVPLFRPPPPRMVVMR